MKTKTLQADWAKYRDACYPDGIPADQNRECHHAFFAGALSVLSQMVESADKLSEDEGAKLLGALIQEAQGRCQEIADVMKARN